VETEARDKAAPVAETDCVADIAPVTALPRIVVRPCRRWTRNLYKRTPQRVEIKMWDSERDDRSMIGEDLIVSGNITCKSGLTVEGRV